MDLRIRIRTKASQILILHKKLQELPRVVVVKACSIE
jgi:hypothetical protein